MKWNFQKSKTLVFVSLLVVSLGFGLFDFLLFAFYEDATISQVFVSSRFNHPFMVMGISLAIGLILGHLFPAQSINIEKLQLENEALKKKLSDLEKL